jgi:hypothetical protein
MLRPNPPTPSLPLDGRAPGPVIIPATAMSLILTLLELVAFVALTAGTALFVAAASAISVWR